MARGNPLQNSFVAGELTPELEGRDDIRQYGQGLRQSVNQIILPQGGAKHRSGTQFESETKGSGPVVLRPFQVGLDQAYMLEMGDEYMRFHANEGRLEIATVVNAVNLDGASAVVGGRMTGLSNVSKVTVSLWFNILGGDSSAMILLWQSAGGLQIERRTDNKIGIAVPAGAGNQVLKITTASYDTSANTGWHNLLLSIDLSIGRSQLYIDDVVPSLSVNSGTVSGTFSFVTGTAANDTIGVGAYGGDSINPISLYFTGDMAEVYANFGESLDLTNIFNRRKFIDGNGKPVGLGLQGDNPTGNPAILYLSGDTLDWHTNKGTGGGLTEDGVLTTASSSPSA